MIIRSQNKRTIVNMSNIDSIAIIENEVRFFNGGVDSTGTLGDYSTEEKAIKVLDTICEFYFRCDGIFEMPADEDVEKLIKARRRHVMTLGVPDEWEMKRKGVFKILSIIGIVLFATLIGVAIDIKSLALLCGSAAALVMMIIFRIEVWAEE